MTVSEDKNPHILNASSNLLGICFVLITGLRLTEHSVNTIADEICMVAALVFISSCLLSYLSIAGKRHRELWEDIANYLFIAGMLLLFAATLMFATGIL